MNETSRRGWLPVWLLAAGHFLSDFYATFMPALLPVVMTKLGLSLTTGGLLVMLFSFTSSILQPIFGYYIDKRGYTWLVLVTLPVSATFICLAGLAAAEWQLFLCIALSGLAASLFHPLGSALLTKVTVEEKKGLAMSVFIGGGNIGVAIAPALVIYYMLTFGVERLPWLIIPAAVLTAAYYFYGVHRIPISSRSLVSSPGNAAWYKSANLLKLNLVMGLRSWPQAAVPNFLAVWLSQQGYTAALAGGLLTAFLLGGAVGSVAGGYVGDKVGRKNCIIACLALCIPLLYLFLTWKEVGFTAYLLLGLAGAALQGTLPSSIVWAQEMLPANAAMASGMMLGLSFGLGGLGAAVTGAAADLFGLQSALLWSLTPLLIAIILTWMIPDNTRSQPTVPVTLKS